MNYEIKLKDDLLDEQTKHLIFDYWDNIDGDFVNTRNKLSIDYKVPVNDVTKIIKNYSICTITQPCCTCKTIFKKDVNTKTEFEAYLNSNCPSCFKQINIDEKEFYVTWLKAEISLLLEKKRRLEKETEDYNNRPQYSKSLSFELHNTSRKKNSKTPDLSNSIIFKSDILLKGGVKYLIGGWWKNENVLNLSIKSESDIFKNIQEDVNIKNQPEHVSSILNKIDILKHKK